MSVESQTAGKLESTSTDVDYADDIERDITQDDRYEFLKDEVVGSSISTTSDQQSDLHTQVCSMLKIVTKACTLMQINLS